MFRLAQSQPWEPGVYEVEVSIDNEVKQTVKFTVIDEVRVLRLEPGVPDLQQRGSFDAAHVFMTQARYIDCMAHVSEAPINTRLTGKLYSVETGSMLGETMATTRTQGKQSVQLTWENAGWQPGRYRLDVAVEHGNLLSTEIELVHRVSPASIEICHAIDDDSGAIGADWPHYPDDACYAVATFGEAPPGLQVDANWYHTGQRIHSSAAAQTDGSRDQRLAFELARPDGARRFQPGYYSVVISGQSVAREERSFQVHPHSNVRVVAENARSAGLRVYVWLKKYHLDRLLLVIALTYLLALGLLASDYVLEYMLGSGTMTDNVVLNMVDALSNVNAVWVIGWLVAGAAYGALHVRDHRDLSSDLEDQAHTVINMLLALVLSAFVWYQAVFILFGLGYVWPAGLWGLFEKLLWLAPVVGWLGVLAAMGIAEFSFRSEENDVLVFWGPIFAILSALVVVLSGFAGALVVGLPLGLLGGILGSLLDVVSLDNSLGHAFLAVGAGLGFVAGPLVALLIALRDDVQTLWKDWINQRSATQGRRASLLHYLIEEGDIPFKLQECMRISRVTLRVVVVLAALLVVLGIAFDPVVIPVLEWLYNADGFEPALKDAPLVALLPLAIFLVAPLALYWFYRAIMQLTPDLKAAEVRFLRRLAMLPLAAMGVLPLLVWIVSRTAAGTELSPAFASFWVNRVAAVLLIGGVGARLLVLLRHAPETFKLELSFSFDEAALVVLSAMLALLLPTWLWAVLAIVVLVAIGGGLQVLRRIH